MKKIEYLDKIKSKYKWSQWNITFYDTDLNETQLIKIDVYILSKWNYEEIIFNGINIIDFWSNLFLVEIEENKLENYKKLLKKNFKQDWFFAKKLENNRQVPEYKWYFRYKWKTYIMVEGLNKLTEETNPELWIYKWVIVNPELYFWKVWEEVIEVEDKVGDILEWDCSINSWWF